MSAVSLVLFIFRLHRLFIARKDKQLLSATDCCYHVNSEHVLVHGSISVCFLTAESQQTSISDRSLTKV